MSSEPRIWKRGDAEPTDDPMVIDREGLAWGQRTNGGWGSHLTWPSRSTAAGPGSG